MGRKRLTQSQYDKMLELNAGVCCVCKRRGIGVNIHHIDHNPSNNDAENLAVLCVQEHDAHHRPGRYPALNHIKLGAETICQHKREWEAFVAEARRPTPSVLAVVNVYGTLEELHSARLLLQWADGKVVFERLYHLLEGPVDRWTDWMLEEVKWLGDGVQLHLVNEPLPVEHCSCCGRGLSNVLNPNVAKRLTAPEWDENSSCSIYVNPHQPSLAIHITHSGEAMITVSMHKCGEYLRLTGDGIDERIAVLQKPNVRTQATTIVKSFLQEWRPARVFIGTGDDDNPQLIDSLDLPGCWEC